MRIFLFAALLTCGIAHADAPSSEGWIRSCENRLRQAAHAYRPQPTEYDRWEWKVAEGAVIVRYHLEHAELDYQITVESTSQKSHPWQTHIVHNQRFPEMVDEWSLTKVDRGRAATFRAAGMAGMKERDAFLKIFRPALDACLGAS